MTKLFSKNFIIAVLLGYATLLTFNNLRLIGDLRAERHTSAELDKTVQSALETLALQEKLIKLKEQLIEAYKIILERQHPIERPR